MNPLFYSVELDGSIVIDGQLFCEELARRLRMDVDTVNGILEMYDTMLAEAGILITDTVNCEIEPVIAGDL